MDTATLPRISLWRAEFIDAHTETAYRADVQERMARQQRIALWVWAGLLLLFALPDYQALGASPVFWALLAYRAGTAALLLAGAHLLRTRPHWAPRGHLVMALEMVGFPFFFLFIILRPEMRAWTIGMIMVVNLSLFIFVPGRVALSAWVALVGVLGTAATLLLTGTVPSNGPGLVLILGLPAVVGFVSANRLQRAQRQEFVVRARLQEANAALHDEIARRIALQDELQRQATTDPLTGLSNRREFARCFAHELARTERTAAPLSLALLDLDRFKKINDQYGHAAGDAVLRHVARLCRECFRSVDSVGRMGGEEIAVLLPGANLQQAAAVAQRFALRLAATPLIHGENTIAVTATVGVAERTAQETALDPLLLRADRALYAGKEAGRNCVMLAHPDGAPHKHSGNGAAPS